MLRSIISQRNCLARCIYFKSAYSQFKKEGVFVDAKTAKRASVKLYPGFQTSNEERLQSQATSEKVYARQVIEEFYGLNELEYDEEEPQRDQISEREEPLEFDLPNVVQLLKSESVQDICCIELPKEINYADYMIIGTCLSNKHLNAAFTNVNKVYKRSRHQREEEDSSSDSGKYLRKSGATESKWSAMDLGEIVIHLFLPEYRELYDLESLWTCGSEFDLKYKEFMVKKMELEEQLAVLEVDEHENDTIEARMERKKKKYPNSRSFYKVEYSVDNKY